MRTILTLVLAVSLLSLSGCATKSRTGALIGAGVGTAAGYAIGGTKAAVIGAAAGGAGGYMIGNEMDKDDHDDEHRSHPGGQ